MLKDFFGQFVLSIDTGSGEAYTVLPAADFSVMAVPYVKGKQPVVQLVDGSRKISSFEPKFHVDVDIEWKELGYVKYPLLMTWAQTAFANAATATFKFYPAANTAGNAPDGALSGIEVVPEFTEDLIKAVYEGRVRNREAKLSLKGKSLIAAASLPAWLLT